MKSKIDLNKVFKPNSVAIIGASSKEGSVGSELTARLVEFGFKGKIYPVNINPDVVCGIKTVSSVLEIKGGIDLAIIIVPAKFVADVMEQCGKKGVKGAVIISAGFKEADSAGAIMEQQITQIANKYGIALVGPNCLGVINTKTKLNATFAPLQPVSGDIGFASQSGALVSGIINLLPTMQGAGISQLVSLGNQAQINAADIISHWGNDNDIKQILLYIETISDADKFKAAAATALKNKPIIALKSGKSDVGAKAAASHTGSMAGADKYAEAMFESYGIVRENNLRDMFNTAQAFSKNPITKGKNVAIVTNSGGPGILCADRVSELGLNIVDLSKQTKEKLKTILPPFASVNNPVDTIASASREQYFGVMDTLLADNDVDMMIVIYLYITGQKDISLTQDINELKSKYKKPVAVVFMTESNFPVRLEQAGLTPDFPFYNYPEEAALAMKRLYDYSQISKPDADIKSASEKVAKMKFDKETVKGIFKTCQKQNRLLTTFESLEVMKAYGLPHAGYALLKNEKDVAAACAKLGFPMVMKISSFTITHKTDVGGLVLNIKSQEEALASYKKLSELVISLGGKESLEGIVAMNQISGKREFILGSSSDASLGKFLMFGIGGIFAEALNEVKFTALPLTALGVSKLLESKASKFLQQLRGDAAVDKQALFETFFKIDKLVADFEEIEELDLNPLMATKSGDLFAVDARIGLKK